jgi:hypothetical protein
MQIQPLTARSFQAPWEGLTKPFPVDASTRRRGILAPTGRDRNVAPTNVREGRIGFCQAVLWQLGQNMTVPN